MAHDSIKRASGVRPPRKPEVQGSEGFRVGEHVEIHGERPATPSPRPALRISSIGLFPSYILSK